MNGARVGFALLLAGMTAAGSLAWWLQLQPTRGVDTTSLAALPREIGPWVAYDIPLEEVVEAELRTDASLQRAYLHPSGEIVWTYVGYYGTKRGGRPEHVPRGCYTGAGWAILESRRLELSAEPRLRVNEYTIERDGERRLVQFWYRSFRGGGLLGGWDQSLDRLVGRLTEGRADGALVRISTPMLDRDVVAARARLASVAPGLDAQLAAHWPSEPIAP